MDVDVVADRDASEMNGRFTVYGLRIRHSVIRSFTWVMGITMMWGWHTDPHFHTQALSIPAGAYRRLKVWKGVPFDFKIVEALPGPRSLPGCKGIEGGGVLVVLEDWDPRSR